MAVRTFGFFWFVCQKKLAQQAKRGRKPLILTSREAGQAPVCGPWQSRRQPAKEPRSQSHLTGHEMAFEDESLQPASFMNRRDDCSGNRSHGEFSDRAEYLAVFSSEGDSLCGQGPRKGASAFVNDVG
ncbi:hypothetical protein [Wenzhouxiangella marina]|uniref:hypothetical protein n=1 Tax=Wenzhouxiangella marina TaxID=1579979 RepID=UPI0012E311C9|nr:hypothetical protein [Wenzhouxiangella marina]